MPKLEINLKCTIPELCVENAHLSSALEGADLGFAEGLALLGSFLSEYKLRAKKTSQSRRPREV